MIFNIKPFELKISDINGESENILGIDSNLAGYACKSIQFS